MKCNESALPSLSHLTLLHSGSPDAYYSNACVGWWRHIHCAHHLWMRALTLLLFFTLTRSLLAALSRSLPLYEWQSRATRREWRSLRYSASPLIDQVLSHCFQCSSAVRACGFFCAACVRVSKWMTRSGSEISGEISTTKTHYTRLTHSGARVEGLTLVSSSLLSRIASTTCVWWRSVQCRSFGAVWWLPGMGTVPISMIV